MENLYRYRTYIHSVYDGDSITDAELDLGMNISIRRPIRLYGVDTPELRKEQLEAGRVVRDFVRDLILDKWVIIKTFKDEEGKYGRLLADIDIEGMMLSDILLEKGYAKVYFGGTKEKWTNEELYKITKS